MPEATLIVRDELGEVLSCLSEALRHPGIATALALVLSGKGQGEEADCAELQGSAASHSEALARFLAEKR